MQNSNPIQSILSLCYCCNKLNLSWLCPNNRHNYFYLLKKNLTTLLGLQNLNSLTRDWIWFPAVKVPSPNHWTAREFPHLSFKPWKIKAGVTSKIKIIQIFIFGHIFSFIGDLYFLTGLWFTVYCLFISTWRVSFSISYRIGFLEARLVKNLPAMWESWALSLGWKDPLEKGTATHTSILVFWLGDFHGLCSPWGRKESDLTKQPSRTYRTGLVVMNSRFLFIWKCLNFSLITEGQLGQI